MIRIKSEKIILKDRLFDGYVYLDDGKIAAVTTDERPANETYEFPGKYLSPGFIDIHTHGGGGYAFADSNAEDVIKGCDFHLRHGTTTIVPTISASSFCAMQKSLENIHEAKKSGKSLAHILGAHLEGPYLSPKQCGAQCLNHITKPNRREYASLVENFGRSITRWTYAPEHDQGGEFCAFLTSHGIQVSAGHTDAKYEDIKVAIENGCSSVTHLYSCMSTVTRDHGFRSLGVIESAYLRDEFYVEMIADGKHLPPELIRMIVKIKGTDKVALVTDSLAVAGSEITAGTMCGTDFIVEDGVAKLPDRSAFAGSIATADVLVRTLTKDCGFRFPESVKMLTAVQAEMLKLNSGEIKTGKDADLIVFDEDVKVSDVFVNGNKVI